MIGDELIIAKDTKTLLAYQSWGAWLSATLPVQSELSRAITINPYPLWYGVPITRLSSPEPKPQCARFPEGKWQENSVAITRPGRPTKDISTIRFAHLGLPANHGNIEWVLSWYLEPCLAKMVNIWTNHSPKRTGWWFQQHWNRCSHWTSSSQIGFNQMIRI